MFRFTEVRIPYSDPFFSALLLSWDNWREARNPREY